MIIIGRRVFALAAACVFFGVLVVDFMFFESGALETWQAAVSGKAPYVGSLTFEDVRFDDRTHDVRATVSVTLEARKPEVALFDVQMAFDGRRVYNVFDQFAAGSDCTGSDIMLTTGTERAGKELVCRDVPIANTDGGGVLWYPFDAYSARIQPVAKVGAVKGPIHDNEALNVDFETIQVAAGSSLSLSGDGFRAGSALPLQFMFRRKPFIRLTTGAVLAISAIFLWQLARISDAKELLPNALGTLGTLWGLRSLIVDADIKAFPTFVDYAIVSLFVLLSTIVLFKLPGPAIAKDVRKS